MQNKVEYWLNLANDDVSVAKLLLNGKSIYMQDFSAI